MDERLEAFKRLLNIMDEPYVRNAHGIKNKP